MRSRAMWVARSGAVLALVALTGCGYAKRKDVDAQLAQLRTDMTASDQALEGRVDTRMNEMNGRVTTLEQRAQALERDLQSMRSEFRAQIESMKDQLSFNVPVQFEYNASDVRTQDQPVLQRFASVVKEYYPNAVVTVEGFTDPSGSTAFNLRLVLRREIGVGTPRSLQGCWNRVLSYFWVLWRALESLGERPGRRTPTFTGRWKLFSPLGQELNAP